MLFVHCRAHRRLRANTSGKIKRFSGCYYPHCYRLQLFRTTTARCSLEIIIDLPIGFPINNIISLPGAHALRGILTETVFERSASVDIIRVSAGVTVTVESNQQAWTKQSLPQKYSCVGCQLKSDQAIRTLCLKGHVRARGSTL